MAANYFWPSEGHWFDLRVEITLAEEQRQEKLKRICFPANVFYTICSLTNCLFSYSVGASFVGKIVTLVCHVPILLATFKFCRGVDLHSGRHVLYFIYFMGAGVIQVVNVIDDVLTGAIVVVVVFRRALLLALFHLVQFAFFGKVSTHLWLFTVPGTLVFLLTSYLKSSKGEPFPENYYVVVTLTTAATSVLSIVFPLLPVSLGTRDSRRQLGQPESQVLGRRTLDCFHNLHTSDSAGAGAPAPTTPPTSCYAVLPCAQTSQSQALAPLVAQSSHASSLQVPRLNVPVDVQHIEAGVPPSAEAADGGHGAIATAPASTTPTRPMDVAAASDVCTPGQALEQHTCKVRSLNTVRILRVGGDVALEIPFEQAEHMTMAEAKMLISEKDGVPFHHLALREIDADENKQLSPRSCRAQELTYFPSFEMQVIVLNQRSHQPIPTTSSCASYEEERSPSFS